MIVNQLTARNQSDVPNQKSVRSRTCLFPTSNREQIFDRCIKGQPLPWKVSMADFVFPGCMSLLQAAKFSTNYSDQRSGFKLKFTSKIDALFYVDSVNVVGR